MYQKVLIEKNDLLNFWAFNFTEAWEKDEDSEKNGSGSKLWLRDREKADTGDNY